MIVGETSKYFRTSKCLNVFLTDMRKLPLLSVQEEEELVLKAKAGDKEAKDRLINGNLRFIYSIAKIGVFCYLSYYVMSLGSCLSFSCSYDY